jgi:serine/threonine protein kinase
MSDGDQTERIALPLSGPGEPAPEPPQVDGYEVLEWLGEGGMGSVWRARQLSTDRVVALKVMSQRILRSKGNAASRFEREVTLAARLEHPNIARVYESGVHRSSYFYAMELIDGRPLDQYVRKQGLPVKAILQLMDAVCQAVQAAHRRGIIHRDLKPSNILVTSDGQPHVLDFGLARDLLSQDRDREVSVNGDLIGTLAFMSPEQAAGDVDAVDTRSDVYSLGVILYNLLTDRWPYVVTGPDYGVLKRIQEDEPVHPSTFVSAFDRDLEAILLKALAKQPKERYRFAGELAEDIERWLQGLPVAARSIDTIYLLKKFILRNRAAIITVLLVFVIITSAVSIAGYALFQKYLLQRKLDRGIPSNVDAYERTRVMLQQAAFSVFVPEERQSPEVTESDKCFWDFTFAEFLLINGRPQEARELYQKCLNAKVDEKDRVYWLREKAGERVRELGQ